MQRLTLILYLLMQWLPLAQAEWLHLRPQATYADLKIVASLYQLPVRRVLSHPYRAEVGPLDAAKKEALGRDPRVSAISNSEESNVTYLAEEMPSDFGLTAPQRQRWTTGVTIAVPAIVVLFGTSAWDWGKDGLHLGFGNEDWFDKNSYSGGADKVGHMTSLYFQKRFITWLSLKSGHDWSTAQTHGIYTATFVALAFEVGDGMSKFKFSMEDLLMDFIGIGFAALVDYYPRLDELVGLRWQWWPSHEYRDPNFKDRLDFSSDYNGQKVYLSLKTKGIPILRDHWFSRYLTLDVGYFTRGYGADLTPDTKEDNIRSRYFSYGIGLNLGSLIFDSAPESKTARAVGSFTKYWIPPGTTHALERQQL